MMDLKGFSSTNGHKNNQEERGKIFVGGLNKTTTTDTLRQFFCRFGEVEDAVAMWDRHQNRSRCFGYVKFRDPDVVQLVLRSKPHFIDEKEVDVKECLPRSVTMSQSQKSRAHKVFVGGLPPDIDEPTLRRAFQNYGKMTEVLIVSDPQTQKPKGFGFISFENQESAAAAVDDHFVMVNGKKSEVKALDASKGRQTHGAGGAGGAGYHSGGYPAHGGYYGAQPPSYGYGYQQGYPGSYGPGPWSGGQHWGPEQHGPPMMGSTGWGDPHSAQHAAPPPSSSWAMDPAHSWSGWHAPTASASGWGDPSSAAWQHAYGAHPPAGQSHPSAAPPAAPSASSAQASWMMPQSHGSAPPGASSTVPPGTSASQSYNYHPYRR